MSNTTPHSADASAPMQDEHDALPAGTRLGEFELLRVLGVGGFGIVYLAMDHALDRLVAVKEYMPSMMAARGRGTQVSLRSSMHQDTFNIGLRSFVNEAKLLARFNHPSLVKVYRFWEANGTAYMAMPFYPGRTLKEERRSMLHIPDETWLRGVVDPLLGAMEVLHREDVYHRDIAPDNILLLPDGPPVLLDFGAARSVIGDRTQSLTAVLKPSYAPIEQYADVGHLRQGAWTDLYALGAVLHFVVTGRPPVPSASRAVHDEQRPLASLSAEQTGSLPLKILKAIDWALTVSPHTRPQNVKEFRDALDGRFEPPERTLIDVSSLSREPSRAAPSGWAQTLQVPDTVVPPPTVSPAPPVRAVDPPPAAASLDLDLDFSLGMGSGTDVGSMTVPVPPGSFDAARVDAPTAAPAAVPPPPRPPVEPPQAPAPVAAASVTAPASAPSAAPPAEVTPAAQPEPVQAPRGRNSRALPPQFAGEDPPTGRSRTVLFVGVLLGLVLLVLGTGYWVLKDRFLPAVASPPVERPGSPPVVPVVRIEQPPPVAVVEPPAAETVPPAVVSVPDWSASAVQPKSVEPAVKPPAVASAPVVVPATQVRPHVVVTPRGRPTKPVEQPAKPAVPTPRDTCNARTTGSMSSCMRRVCASGPLADHPQCVEMRRDEEW